MHKILIQPQHKPKLSAKAYLVNRIPFILGSLGVPRQQSFLGFKVDIEDYILKKVYNMTEQEATRALNVLKDALKDW